jgi:hypothetical protein
MMKISRYQKRSLEESERRSKSNVNKRRRRGRD